MNLGLVIAEKRKAKKITQQELANFMNVSKASVSKWETGQTYPDITLLPLLAAYFDISIDELLNYEPQLSNKEIQHIYTSLKKSFETKAPEEVLASIHSFVRRYYSCYPFVLQMGMLIINHLDLFPGEDLQEKMQKYLKEVLELFVHVRRHAKEPDLILQASRLEAYVLLQLKEADQVLGILGDQVPVCYPIESMIAAAFQLKGQNDRSVAILQSALYQNVAVVMNFFTNYLQYLLEQPEKFDETVNRGVAFAKLFDLEHLNPMNFMNFQLSVVFSLAQQNRETEALDMLEEFVTVFEHTGFPIELHGDGYFDQVDSWFETLETGNQLPRESNMMKESLIEMVLDSQFLPTFKDQERIRQVYRRLEDLKEA